MKPLKDFTRGAFPELVVDVDRGGFPPEPGGRGRFNKWTNATAAEDKARRAVQGHFT